MPFATMNGVNAAKGMAGTARTNTATFNPQDAQPLPQGQAPDGMGGPSMGLSAPVGSSYTQGAGMASTGRMGASTQPGGPGVNMRMQGGLLPANGVNPGLQVPSAVGPQQMPQMSAAEMNDPNNAALAGYAFSATQDKTPSASTNPVQQPQAPQASTLNSGPVPAAVNGQSMRGVQAPVLNRNYDQGVSNGLRRAT